MLGSKLLLMLEPLNSREFKRFVEFVHSPYFNKHERLQALADYLLLYLPDRNEKALDRHEVFWHLFPDETDYQEQKLSDLMSYLVKLLEQFLALQAYEQNEVAQQLHLLTALASRDLHKPFQQVQRGLRRQLDKQVQRDERFYLQEYDYWDESDLYFMRQQKRTKDVSLQNKVDALDLFYLTAKLKNACEMVNRQHVISESYHFWLTDEVLHYLRDHIHEYHEHPAIVAYFHILKTLTETEAEDHFHELKRVLATNISRFAQEELRYMYLYVQNYIIHRINKGHADFLRELFELYQWLLETGIILEDGFLSQWDYKNIVSAGYRLGEFTWTEKFIHAYKENLREEERENAFNYNLANLYYFRQEYRNAKRLLQTVEFSDVYYALGARSLLLKIYYDTQDFDPLFSLLDSFAVYLKRNKEVSSYQQQIHLSFLKLVRRLANMRSKQLAGTGAIDQPAVNKLWERVNETREVANLAWLKKRLEEMEAAI